MRSRPQRIVHGFCRLLIRMVFGVFFRARAYGMKNVPESGGALVLSNHQSYIDPMLIGAPLRRHLTYMARDTLFRNPIFAELMRLVSAFPVRRGKPDKDSIRRAVRYLESGEAMVMFPEGTRSRDGRVQQFKGGFRVLVRRAHVPVVPAAVDGPYRAWPRSRLLPRPRPIRVMYGAPISPEEFEGLSDEEAADLVFRSICRLLERLRGMDEPGRGNWRLP